MAPITDVFSGMLKKDDGVITLPPKTTPAPVTTPTKPPTIVQPTVSASSLVNPASAVRLPQTTPTAIPERVGSTVQSVYDKIKTDSASYKELQKEQDAFGSFGESGFDIQNKQLERFGVTGEKLKELEDIQLQLSDRARDSAITETRIANAGGQTLAQGQREVTQEQREEAVRSAALASRASVLQGNIETGRALAKDATDIAMADRTFQANTKIKQIEYLQGRVDEETSVALEDEKRKYEAELATIKEVKEATANALVSGATQQEASQLTDPTIDDATKLALAQSIIARGAGEDRRTKQTLDNLDIQIKQANLNKLTAPEKSGIDWGERANVIKLASEGDPLAIASLGYDPRQKGLTPDVIMESERKQAETGASITMIDGMLSNSRGIGAITGQVKSPTLSGFFMGGKKDGSLSSAVAAVPVIGNIQGAVQSRNDRDKILSDLQNLYNTEGFQEFIGLKQSGLTFGSLTEGERQSIFSSANRLNSALLLEKSADGSSGRVEGYQGTADQLRADLEEVQKGLIARNEEIATRLLLDQSEMQEIINL